MLIREHNCFYEILPWPEKIAPAEGGFELNCPVGLVAERRYDFQAGRLKKAMAYFDMTCGESSQVIRLAEDPALPADGWRITVAPQTVTLQSSDHAGMNYAAAALIQMLAVATTAGKGRFLAMTCGTAEAVPRFAWRGFMLDSARHFRSRETVLKLLRAMAHFRYNVFHWHLTDNEGWRLPSRVAPELSAHGELQDGAYSYEDIAAVREEAGKLGIRIVPEFDLPGHSRLLTRILPETGCISGAGDEVCIGRKAVRDKVGELLDEVMELFPESTEIHLGGDEADAEHWEACPDCRKALRERNLRSVRELEHEFVLSLVRQVQASGRRAIVWNDAGIYPADVIVQIWVEKNRLETLKNGNKVIMSPCGRCYTDRLFDWELKFAEFQDYLGVQDNYLYDPYTGHEDFRSQIMGVECCAWGGYLAERRVYNKVLPRLTALSEVCCGDQRQKVWTSFVQRAARQRDAGSESIW